MSLLLTALLASALTGADPSRLDLRSSPELAREALHTFAPLAERVGRPQLRAQLEEVSFPVVHPEAHASLLAALPVSQDQARAQLDELLARTGASLDEAGIEARVSGRVKSLYSTHRKMERKGLSIDQVRDRTGIRVIVPSEQDCYEVLSLLTAEHELVDRTLKDYIAHPKANGYQSLHASLLTETQAVAAGIVEVQVRSLAMHEHAEGGVAAHWRYKHEA
jgi:GTP pyrophosphokinase